MLQIKPVQHLYYKRQRQHCCDGWDPSRLRSQGLGGVASTSGCLCSSTCCQAGPSLPSLVKRLATARHFRHKWQWPLEHSTLQTDKKSKTAAMTTENIMQQHISQCWTPGMAALGFRKLTPNDALTSLTQQHRCTAVPLHRNSHHVDSMMLFTTPHAACM